MEGRGPALIPDHPAADGFLSVRGDRLECAWTGPGPHAAPTIVFLHEGLGSASSWRGFPARVAEAAGCGALVYSRRGYGRSGPAPMPRPVEFMHEEADLLADVLRAAGVRDAILFGHSDGASIALIHAALHPSTVLRGLVLEAPHVFVEDCTIDSIARIDAAYESSGMRERLARHHADPDATFRGWTDVWLRPAFRAWNIRPLLPSIHLPALVVQGTKDEYGTWAQVECIQRASGGSVDVIAVPDCGHAPHHQQPDAVLHAAVPFIRHVLG